MRLVYIKSAAALILFIIQYAAIAFLILSGPLYPGLWYLWIPYSIGWMIGIWAILAMGPGNLNAGPEIMPGSRLKMAGPYRLIRHPMYAAILLVLVPLIFTDVSTLRILVLLLLFLNLIFKIHYEESRLLEGFEGYKHYSSKTWRLLPFVY